MFRFKINGVDLVDMPEGWDMIRSSVKRDDATGILLLDATINLKFFAGQDGYSILKTAWDNNHTGESYIDIYQRFPDSLYRLIHSGTIFHSSIKFELINQNLSFKTEDRGFYAMINNNKKIETSVTGGKTKNEKPIAPCPSFNLSVHKVNNGTLQHVCQAFKLIDVLNYLVTFMTDGRMTLQAPCFESGGVYEGICLVNGHELSKHDGTKAPIVSWETLSTDLVKRLNVQFSIIGTIDNPIMRIDTFNDFYGQYNALDIQTVPDELTLSTDENRLYSVVEVGSQKFEKDSNLHFPDVYALTSFRTESFHFKGTNNIDRKLDLVGTYNVSNALMEVVINLLSGWEGYEDDVFMVQYNVSNNWTHDSNWLGSLITTSHLYNEMFNNQNILSRWSSCFPNDTVVTLFNPSINSFRAETDGDNTKANLAQKIWSNDATANDVTEIQTIPFWNDYAGTAYDPSNNYGGGNIVTPQGNNVQFPNLYFTAPVNGFYTFYASVRTYVHYSTFKTPLIFAKWDNINIGIRFRKSSSTQTILNEYDGPAYVVIDNWPTRFGQGNWGEVTFNVAHSIGTFMNAGEIMECIYYHYVRDQDNKSDKDKYQITPKSGYFACNNIDTGGGYITPSNPDGYKSLKLDFQYPMNLNQYLDLINSKQGLIRVPINNTQNLNGWVENVTFDHSSGLTKFSLITDGNTIYR